MRQRSNSISEHLDGSKKKSWRTKQLRTPKNPFERLEPPENLDMKNLKHQLSSASSQSSTHSPAVFAACRASDKRAKNVDMGATINLDSDLDLRPRNQSTHKRKAKLPPLNYNSSGGPEEDFPLSSSYSALRVQMPHIDSKDDFSSSDEEKTPTFGGNMGPSVVIGVTAEALKKARYRLTDEEEKLVRQVVSYKEGDVKSMECRRRLWTLTGYACGFVPEALEKDIEDRDYNPTVLHKQIQRGGETVLGMSLMNDTQYVKYESTSSSDDDLYMGPQINASLPRPASEMNAQKPRNKSRINTYHSADNAQLRQVAAASASSSAKTLPDFLFEDFKSGNTTRRHNKTRRSKFK